MGREIFQGEMKANRENSLTIFKHLSFQNHMTYFKPGTKFPWVKLGESSVFSNEGSHLLPR